MNIDQKYAQLGGPNGFLGKPETVEAVCPDQTGHFRHFEHGSIYWHPSTDAHEVHGAIRDLWSSLGWEQSWLGYPATDEGPAGAVSTSSKTATSIGPQPRVRSTGPTCNFKRITGARWLNTLTPTTRSRLPAGA
jgi:uncharacterized protein with LGFP repeats